MRAISDELKETFECYVTSRCEPCGFIMACLCNDLVGAVGRADDVNIHIIPDIVNYMYSNMPSTCWGSPDIVRDWLMGGD